MLKCKELAKIEVMIEAYMATNGRYHLAILYYVNVVTDMLLERSLGFT